MPCLLVRALLVTLALAALPAPASAATAIRSFPAQLELRVDGGGRLVVLLDDRSAGAPDTVEQAVFYTTERPLVRIEPLRVARARVELVVDDGACSGLVARLPDGSTLLELRLAGPSFYVRDGRRVALDPAIGLARYGGASLLEHASAADLAASIAAGRGRNPTFDEAVPERVPTVRRGVRTGRTP